MGGAYNYFHYYKGYFHAGLKIVTDIINNPNPSDIDLLIYPIVFLFRHSIELALKHLSIVVPKIWGETIDTALTHNLITDWKKIKVFLLKEPGIFNTDNQLIDKFEKFLNDFTEIDPKGEAFRYPVDKGGTRHLSDMSVINIKNFHNIIVPIGETLDYWFSQVHKLKEYDYNIKDYIY